MKQRELKCQACSLSGLDSVICSTQCAQGLKEPPVFCKDPAAYFLLLNRYHKKQFMTYTYDPNYINNARPTMSRDQLRILEKDNENYLLSIFNKISIDKGMPGID